MPKTRVDKKFRESLRSGMSKEERVVSERLNQSLYQFLTGKIICDGCGKTIAGGEESFFSENKKRSKDMGACGKSILANDLICATCHYGKSNTKEKKLKDENPIKKPEPRRNPPRGKRENQTTKKD